MLVKSLPCPSCPPSSILIYFSSGWVTELCVGVGVRGATTSKEVETIAWRKKEEEEKLYQWGENGEQKGGKKMWRDEWARNFATCVSLCKPTPSRKLTINIFISHSTHWNFWDEVSVSLRLLIPHYIPCEKWIACVFPSMLFDTSAYSGWGNWNTERLAGFVLRSPIPMIKCYIEIVF